VRVGYWVHNYLAKQAGAAIYRLPQRWRPISRRCAGGRRGRRLLARKLSGFHRGSSPAITGMQDVIHCDVVQRLSTWRTAVSGQRWRGLSQLIDEQVGTVKLIRDRARAYLVPRSLLRRDYPLTREHESRRWRKSRRKGSPAARGAELVILFSHCTMVITIRAFDRPFCRARTSNFYVITC
jgi:hypothetical protein